MDLKVLQKLTRRIRHDILTMTTAAGSGHPTSSLSAVELMTVLFFKYLRYDLNDPKNSANDRVIFSKGHASPLYYALYAAAGVISPEELAKYRTFDSILEGHPTGRFRYTEAATGSLGQGLAIGLGEALAIRLVHSSSFIVHGKTNSSLAMNQEPPTTNRLPRVFVLSGDGELAEGSVWEAAAAASFQKVGNLFLLVDVNRLGQSDPTMYEYDLSVYKNRFEAFGWKVVVVENGNDLDAVSTGFDVAFKGSAFKGVPTVILAKTKKGAGISFLEDKEGWHGKPLSKDELPKALAELGNVDLMLTGKLEKPASLSLRGTSLGVTRQSHPEADIASSQRDRNDFTYDKPVATRKAFGNALLRLGKTHPELVVLDGDVKNSTYTEFFAKEFPERFFELFIAEQTLAGSAVGFSARGLHPVVSTFACFLTRAADQIRMAAFSGASMLVNGSHAGVSIGEDGPSQMGLEDIAQFRAVHGSMVLYPSDAVSAERLTELAVNQKGIVYIRTTRPETPILYKPQEKFVIGGSKVFSVKNEQVTVVAAGITLHEALIAQKEVPIRVIDCYSIKPIDVKTLKKAASETKAIIVVEDHYPEGGLGDAVKTALLAPRSPGEVGADDPSVPIFHLAVYKTPRSGKTAQLLEYEGLAAAHIIAKVQEVMKLNTEERRSK